MWVPGNPGAHFFVPGKSPHALPHSVICIMNQVIEGVNYPLFSPDPHGSLLTGKKRRKPNEGP
jgi:hypothetical protein